MARTAVMATGFSLLELTVVSVIMGILFVSGLDMLTRLLLLEHRTDATMRQLVKEPLAKQRLWIYLNQYQNHTPPDLKSLRDTAAEAGWGPVECQWQAEGHLLQVTKGQQIFLHVWRNGLL